MDDNTAAAAILVPIFGTLIAFGAPIAAFVIFRVLAHRERMEMIRHGMVPTNGGKGWQPRGPAMPPQAGAMPGPMPAPGSMPAPGPYDNYAAQNALRKGIMLTAVGLALTIGLSFIGFQRDHNGQMLPVLGPWLLGGLVPLFVGLAQVVMALISGATLGNLAPRSRQAGSWTPPPGMHAGGNPGVGPGYTDPFGTAPRGVTYEDSYTYRPGDTQELRRATPPPERMP